MNVNYMNKNIGITTKKLIIGNQHTENNEIA